MRMLTLAAASVAAMAVSGCVYISDNDIPAGDFSSDFTAERLYGAWVEPGGVRVVAASNGCTTEESFRADVDRYTVNAEPRYVVRFQRDTPDRCRAFLADGVELFFSRERLGLPPEAPITVANRIGR